MDATAGKASRSFNLKIVRSTMKYKPRSISLLFSYSQEVTHKQALKIHDLRNILCDIVGSMLNWGSQKNWTHFS